MLQTYIRSLRSLSRSVSRAFGKFPRECPMCGYHGKFLGYGYPFVCDIYCPKCGSLERHRLLHLADQKMNFFGGKDVLHFAPETGLANLLKARVGKYQSADITPGKAEIVRNIEAIEEPDARFDCVVCSHVLEHVDDKKALAEVYRVLKPGGVALIMLPVIEGWSTTYENKAVTTPEDRMRHYGQSDHVRYYGADVRDRIRAAGFKLDEFTAEGEDVLTYGLARGEKVFVATKPP
jgi:SAM-dependent methyltransferase